MDVDVDVDVDVAAVVRGIERGILARFKDQASRIRERLNPDWTVQYSTCFATKY
jgi:hypothetical protein